MPTSKKESKQSTPTQTTSNYFKPQANKHSEGLICYLTIPTHDWEEMARCTILQWRDWRTQEEKSNGPDGVSGFLVQRVRDNNALYGGTIFVMPESLVTIGELWKLHDDYPFDDDIPF